MLLLHEADQDWTSAPQEVLDKALAEHGEFIQYLTERGRPFSGEALRPSYTATTLRPKGDEVLVTDGPFVELKEHIGGFYVIEADTLDEAIEVAKRVPMSAGVEIRPIWEA